MPVASTSIESYASLGGKLSAMQSQVLGLIIEDRTLSNRDIAEILGKEICTVTGRVNELCEMGCIRCWGTKKDIRTNRTVKVWEAIVQ